MKYAKKAFIGVLTALDWLLYVVTAGRRPVTMDDANAQYGLDTVDALGGKIGRSGPRPGERSNRAN